MKRGVDVSEYQGLLDYDQLAKCVDFVYIRASIGRIPDKNIDRNIQETDRVKLPRGFYHAYAWNIPLKDQIAEHNALLQGVEEQLPKALDLEKFITGSTDPKVVLTAWQSAFTDSVVYSSPSFIKSYLQDPRLTNIRLWLANYGTNYPGLALPWFPQPWAWQFAIVPGAAYGCKPSPVNIPKIDLDIIFGE